MSQGLFRQSAVSHQSNRLDGEVVVMQPVAVSLLLTVLLVVILIAFIFLSQSSFDRRETVMGYLKPELGLSRIRAPRAGLVSQVLVDDGAEVQAGQPLLRLSVLEQLVDGESLATRLLTALAQQQALVSQRQSQLVSLYEQQKHELEARQQSGLSLLLQLDQQQNLTLQRIELQQQKLQRLLQLEQNGAVSTDTLSNQRELVLSLEQQLAEQKANQQAQRNTLQQLEGQLARLPSEQAQQNATIAAELNQLEQQKSQLQAQGEILIAAPVSGRVTNLMAELGQQINAGASLLTLVPAGAKLTAVLLVPTRAYGFIQTGQSTRLRYDAFPYQRFGSYQGKVIKTARAIVLPDETEMPIPIQEPVYRVEVQLESQHIRAYDKVMPLQSGMLLSADIVLEKRSLLAWLFEPILSLKGRL